MAAIQMYVELVLLCPSLLKEGHKVPLDSSTTLILRLHKVTGLIPDEAIGFFN
jgi:hypothetical protein